jgi:hypothetical protein
MRAFLRKLPGGIMRPDDDQSMEALKSVAVGAVISVEWKHPRNYKFHKKFFAMLHVGYEAWEPVEADHNGLPMQKNFDRFREDMIIAAGFYDTVINIRGEARAKAHSISFGAMDQEKFDKLYNAVADVMLKVVLKNYTKDDLESVVNEIIGFVSTM